MSAVVKGHANKVIAMDLDLSQRTVEIHRSQVMKKMQVRTLADLVISEQGGAGRWPDLPWRA